MVGMKAERLAELQRIVANRIRPCSCTNGWVDDENWSPYDDEGPRHRRRTEGDGLIPCGFCNLGGWDHDPDDGPVPVDPNDSDQIAAELLAEVERLTGEQRGESFYAIRFTDGELIYGEYAWLEADGPYDWTVADESDHDEPTEYEIVRMHVEPITRRTFGGPAPDDEDT